MSSSPLNPMKHLERQGANPKHVYAAIVVDNNDPRMAGWVRVRVPGMHSDKIPDKHLPWAMPNGQSYAVDADKPERAGFVNIPPVGAKVGVRFPYGDPHKPELCDYPGDAKTVMDEAKTNYPNRAVMRLENGAYVIADKKTNELLITNPGDMHLVVLGDCSQTIVGQHTQIITGSVGDVPSYLLNASDTKIREIRAKSAGGVGGKAGSQTIHVKGDQNVIVEGNRTVTIKGNDFLKVERSRTEKVSGEHIIDSNRSETN